MDKETLINLVIDQIIRDLDVGDSTAIVELLECVPIEKLQGYLSEVN